MLGVKPAPARARPIGPDLSTSAAVTWVAGIGGECAAISASDADSMHTGRLCMHVVTESIAGSPIRPG